MIVVVGDFNVWFDVTDHAGLSQIIYEPTHTAGDTLDHVYINKYQIHVKYFVDDKLEISTDHFPIFIDFPSLQESTDKMVISFRMKKNVPLRQLQVDLQQVYSRIDFSANLKNNRGEIKQLKKRVLPNHHDSQQLANYFNDIYVQKVTKIRKSIPLAPGDNTVIIL